MRRLCLGLAVLLIAAVLAQGAPVRAANCFGPLERLSPEGAIEPTAEWGLAAKTGPFIFVSGMRGIDPLTNEIVLDPLERVRQAYENMFFIAGSAGAAPEDLIETITFVLDMQPQRSLDNEVRREIYGDGPYPNRTIVEISELNGTDPDGQGDFFEVKGTFYVGCPDDDDDDD